jgi:hypothetical protein
MEACAMNSESASTRILWLVMGLALIGIFLLINENCRRTERPAGRPTEPPRQLRTFVFPPIPNRPLAPPEEPLPDAPPYMLQNPTNILL